MANIEVRELIRKYRLKHYEVAQALGINECTLSRWLQLLCEKPTPLGVGWIALLILSNYVYVAIEYIHLL